jgi:hypothetical protein
MLVVKQAIPGWVEINEIQSLYELCTQLSVQTNTPYEVDHIELLNSNEVCGLHCMSNLRIIPRTENRQKGNSRVDIQGKI